MDTITKGIDPIINLTETPTKEAMELAKSFKTIHVQIHNCPPVVGKFEHGTNHVVDLGKMVSALEDAIWEECTDPIRFRLLKRVHTIMSEPCGL